MLYGSSVIKYMFIITRHCQNGIACGSVHYARKRGNWNLRQPDAAQSLSPLTSSPSPMRHLNSLSLSVDVLERFYCSYVTLRCDPELWLLDLDLWPLTLNICRESAVQWSNFVRNLSAIGQCAAELLRFEYLTSWPWTCITCITA